MTEIKPFIFKKFKVEQDLVPMKVGTDGVLVGVWAELGGVSKTLDIGTGTGVISLILAQRLSGKSEIHSIDVDDKAIVQSTNNFKNSPWPENFVVHHSSIQDFAMNSNDRFDLIISNPPFFTGGLLSENNDRNDVRHTIKLPHGDLLLAVSKLLKSEGSLAIILPYLQGLRFIEISESYRLYPFRITEVKSRMDKTIERLLIQFRKGKSMVLQNEIIIHSEGDEFSSEYKSLTRDFYLNF
ncbi:MAG: methyltransferase domain-containing protein [Saprospiraceae bacterium]